MLITEDITLFRYNTIINPIIILTKLSDDIKNNINLTEKVNNNYFIINLKNKDKKYGIDNFENFNNMNEINDLFLNFIVKNETIYWLYNYNNNLIIKELSNIKLQIECYTENYNYNIYDDLYNYFYLKLSKINKYNYTETAGLDISYNIIKYGKMKESKIILIVLSFLILATTIVFIIYYKYKSAKV